MSMIDSDMLIDVAVQHIIGNTELSPTQLSALKLLLDKVLPNAKPEEDTNAANNIEITVRVQPIKQ